MKTIWKKKLETTGLQTIDLPDGAVILCVRERNDEVCFWFECDPSNPPYPRSFAIIGTGHPLNPSLNMTYIGTAVIHGGQLVWHVFEV